MPAAKVHPYQGLTVYLGTQHEKDRALRDALSSLGIECSVVDIDTDQFGTFSGEYQRTGSVREVLRKKAEAVYQSKPDARLVLVSEGTFGPHPVVGLIPTDHEALLLIDRSLGIEIYADELSTITNHAQREISDLSGLNEALSDLKYPSHGVILQPGGVPGTLFKNLEALPRIIEAVESCFSLSQNGKVVIFSDMRAHLNPSRMQVIEKAGWKLIEKLESFCPQCSSIGFWISQMIKGLPCMECGSATEFVKTLVWSCLKCKFSEMRPRDDEKLSVSPRHCPYCNP